LNVGQVVFFNSFSNLKLFPIEIELILFCPNFLDRYKMTVINMIGFLFACLLALLHFELLLLDF